MHQSEGQFVPPSLLITDGGGKSVPAKSNTDNSVRRSMGLGGGRVGVGWGQGGLLLCWQLIT